MALRTRLGILNGVRDLWVSKPGIDVRSAQPGQFLLGGSSGVNQIIASGRQRMQGHGAITFPQSYGAIGLPGSVAGLTDLYLWGTTYMTEDSAGNVIYTPLNSFIQSGFRIISGNLYVTANIAGGITGTLGSAATPRSHWAQWVIFRGRL